MRMKDKIAAVTGAGSGIGREIALAFAREGAKLGIADVNLDGANAVAKEIGKAGGAAIGLRMDVTKEAEVDGAVETLVKTFGGLDVIVSNAGIQHIDPLDKLSYADWRKVVSIHLDGGFLVTRAALRQMYKQGRGGAIIYMGSVHSHEASPLKAPYVAAKHALLGLCKTVAKEGAEHGVRANVICPGFVRTPLVDKQIPEQAKELGISEEEVVKKVMLGDTVDGEFTTTADVAELAVFLAAFPTNALTGQSVVVSHGWFMQ
ncbi:MAG TPA: 3-hydroxybutyrate dehydrogenase [Alphaproteobacteria bacterium]|nr:3-hydroxybutyrate dehydrogenase [Alphaproteobacteria bacterium]